MSHSDYSNCRTCEREVLKELAVYDDRALHFFCDYECFYDWTGDNHDKVVDFYEQLNISEGI